MVYHTGMFGWTGTPFAFQVVTRVLSRMINKAISGDMLMYVDDMIGVAVNEEVKCDQDTAHLKAIGLLGPDAMEDTKNERGRRLDIIGYTVDLDKRIVTISHKNFLKSFYGFFTCNYDQNVEVVVIERLASWASRYSDIIRQLKPFTQDLYKEIAGIKNRHISIRVSSPFITAVLVWRSFLTLLSFDESKFARPLVLLDPRACDYEIQFDASLEGVGVFIRRIGCDEVLFVGHHMYPYMLNGDATYQNSMEFIALMCGILCLIVHGAKHISVKIIGDSTSTLQWVSTERFKSKYSQRTALLFICLCVEFNVNIIETEFVPGVENVIADKLSRGSSPASLGFSSWEDFSSPIYVQLFTICDPTCTDEDFFDQWHNVMKFIRNISPMDMHVS